MMLNEENSSFHQYYSIALKKVRKRWDSNLGIPRTADSESNALPTWPRWPEVDVPEFDTLFK